LNNSDGKRPGQIVLVLAFAVMCVVWGTTWKVIQIGLAGIPPFTGVALRFTISAVVLLILAAVLGVKLGRTRRERALWWINGLLSFTISYGVVYWAEQWVPSGLAAVLFATYPLFVAVLGRVLLPSETVSRRELAAILVSFAGVGVIFLDDFSALGGTHVSRAAAIMLLSPIAAAAGSLMVKRWGSGIHPFSLTAVPMAITAGITGAIALATERTRTLHWDATSIGALLYLALLGSVVTFTLYYWLLAYLPVKRLALVAYVIPMIAVLIGVTQGEPLTGQILGGSAMVLIGVSLAVHR
jgi:drug/metabolite transporter (DMT)-like permease